MSTELYGFEANVSLTKEQIQRLLRCGIEPSHVSYEAYKYALALLSESGFKKERRLRIASIILEEATQRAGIHTSQLQAQAEEASPFIGRHNN